jgi:signal transduction histidine kinase
MSPQVALLGILGLALDASACRTPAGHYRVGIVFYLALACLGEWQLGLGLGFLGGLLLPKISLERASFLWNQAPLLILPLLGHLPDYRLQVAVVSVGLWNLLGLYQQLPQDLQGRRLGRVLWPFWMVAPAGVVWAAQGNLSALASAALLSVLGQGALNAIFRIYASQASEAIAQSDLSQMAVERLRLQLSEQESSLAQEARQRRLVERLAEQLAQGPDLAATQRAILDTLGRILVVRSVLLYLWNPTSENLEISCWLSPESPRLAQASLESCRESLVELAWERQKWVTRQGEPGSLLRLEDQAVALPLVGVGVIYVGRQTHPWTADDVRILEWVGEKAALGLQAAGRHHQQMLEQHQASSLTVQLREQVSLLARLVESSSWLNAQLATEGILVGLEHELASLLPHRGGGCFLKGFKGLEVVHSWGQPHPQALVQSELALQQGRAVQLGDLCLVPMLETPQGVLWVHSPATTTEPMQLLALLAMQLNVALRNAQLYAEVQQAKQRLEESQAQLVQSSKLTAIGQLAAGVAHELNTPLGAASLSLDLLGMQYPQAEKHIDNAQSALDKARNIVDKLLAYSRRTHDAELEPVDLAEVVDGSVELVHSRLRQQRVQVETQLLPHLRVKARKVELQQVLVNLLLNAVDAYPEAKQGKPIRVSLGSESGWAYIEVQDWAGGIAPEIQSQVFDPFFTTKPVGKGTGLGLSVSHEICQSFQGQLSFVSQSGEGTKFRMSFPLVT